VDESAYYIAIALAFFGFVALAFILLFPVYRFLRREEEKSEQWTDAAIAERRRRAIEHAERAAASGDGSRVDGGPGAPGEPPELRAPRP
jgi:hypothetical protein